MTDLCFRSYMHRKVHSGSEPKRNSSGTVSVLSIIGTIYDLKTINHSIAGSHFVFSIDRFGQAIPVVGWRMSYGLSRWLSIEICERLVFYRLTYRLHVIYQLIHPLLPYQTLVFINRSTKTNGRQWVRNHTISHHTISSNVETKTQRIHENDVSGSWHNINTVFIANTFTAIPPFNIGIEWFPLPESVRTDGRMVIPLSMRVM